MYNLFIFTSLISILTLIFDQGMLYHQFCESKLWSNLNYHNNTEIFNVSSSLLMLYYPVKSILKKIKGRNYILEKVLILTSVGSALYHYKKTYFTSLFDELPMMIYAGLVVHMASKDIHVQNLNLSTSIIIILLKIFHISSVLFVVFFTLHTAISGLYLVSKRVFSLKILLKFFLIASIRQFTEDMCEYLPLFIAFIGHPLWHIFASKYSVELADELYNYLHIPNRHSYKSVPV